jgi:hypothetical protein
MNPYELNGKFQFEETEDYLYLVYEPTETERNAMQSSDSDLCNKKIHLVTIERNRDVIEIQPIKTSFCDTYYLSSRYNQIKKIILQDLDFSIDKDNIKSYEDPDCQLDFLPRGFVLNPKFGLGFKKEINVLLEFVEQYTTCDSICIFDGDGKTHVDKTTFFLHFKDYNKLRKETIRISSRARKASLKVRRFNLGKYLAEKIKIAWDPLCFSRNRTEQHFIQIAQSDSYIDEQEQEVLIEKLRKNTRIIASRPNNKLQKLQQDFELVSLETLIQGFAENVNRNHNEEFWQKFFFENPFALQMVFGFPVLLVGQQVYAGSVRFQGDGLKRIDYLVKNAISNNVAIIEIKTPQTELLQKSAYRKDVYPPSSELSGAVTQVLRQKYEMERNFASAKDANDYPDIESLAVHCCLIAGSMKAINSDKRKIDSLELFRGNLKNVQVICFDELEAKLKQLLIFLTLKTDS